MSDDTQYFTTPFRHFVPSVTGLRSLKPYDREKAVSYAQRWALGRNPAYYNYDNIGGDCTNFASQVLFAGGCLMNYEPTFGWYYIDANRKSPSWTGVEYLYQFLTRPRKNIGPVAVEVGFSELQPGDIVQLSFDGQRFHHSPVVTQILNNSPEGILICAHTYDALNKPLSEYHWVKIRCLHILGSNR